MEFCYEDTYKNIAEYKKEELKQKKLNEEELKQKELKQKELKQKELNEQELNEKELNEQELKASINELLTKIYTKTSSIQLNTREEIDAQYKNQTLIESTEEARQAYLDSNLGGKKKSIKKIRKLKTY